VNYPKKGKFTGRIHSGYFFFFVPFSGGVTIDEGFDPFESDRFLFSGTLSASFFFFSFAIEIVDVCRFKDEIVMSKS
jgi:hypothetical protein